VHLRGLGCIDGICDVVIVTTQKCSHPEIGGLVAASQFVPGGKQAFVYLDQRRSLTTPMEQEKRLRCEPPSDCLDAPNSLLV
jgi:hypothetical protein